MTSAPRLATLALLAVLAACGKGDNHGTAAGADQSEVEQDKTIALSDHAFYDPILLHINADDTDTANDLDAHGPGNPYPGPYAVPGFPCRSDYGSRVVDLLGSVDLSNPSNHAVGTWLMTNGWVQAQLHSYAVMGSNGMQTFSVTCHQVTIEPLRYLQGATDSMDRHHGLVMPFLVRACTRWTYANAYKAEIPGKGQVKQFAGTFEFRYVSLIAGIATEGTGTYSVKMYLDPDNGNWQRTFTQLNDNSSITWNAPQPNAPTPDQPAVGMCNAVVGTSAALPPPH